MTILQVHCITFLLQMDYSTFDRHIEVLFLTPHMHGHVTPCGHMTTPDSHMTLLYEIAVKWVLNAISTGAHVLRGKVLGNRMIDLQVRSVKMVTH